MRSGRFVFRGAAVLLLAGAVWAVGCGKKAGGGGNNNQNDNQNGNTPCPEGTDANGPACVPVFDTVPAVDEIPVLGGGSVTVGVERCAHGPGCAEGFAGDGTGGCDPVRPAASCGSGELAVLGETTCQAIRDCGSGTWGNLDSDPSAVHVDASYGGGASDGSAGAPYTTIGAALANASAGDRILVAEGTYPENLSLAVRVTLSGRCPSLVTIQGQDGGVSDPPTITVSTSAGGSLIEGVRLTGPGQGVQLNQADDVRLREVEIADTGLYGVSLQRGGSVLLRRVKIAGASVAGVILYGGSVTAIDTVVRDTAPSPDGSFGRGLDLGCDHMGTGGCPTLDATGIIVEGNHEAGILIAGGQAALVRSLVADTQPNAGHGMAGMGVQTQCDTTSADCPTLTVTGSVVEGNHAAGIMAVGTTLDIRDTVIRDTHPQDDGRFGSGLVAQCDSSMARCADLDGACLLLERNHQSGLSVVGGDAELVGIMVRDTEAQEIDHRGGQGLVVQCEGVTRLCGRTVLTDSGFVGNTYAGLFVQGSDLVLRGVYVGQTLPAAETDDDGVAIYAQCDTGSGGCPELDIDASLFQDHRAEGIAFWGGKARMTRSTVDGVGPQLSDGEFGFGLYVDGQSTSVVPTFDASACNIADGTVAGIFFYQGGGFVTRSWIHGAEYSVVQAGDSAVLTDNLLEGTKQDEPLIQ